MNRRRLGLVLATACAVFLTGCASTTGGSTPAGSGSAAHRAPHSAAMTAGMVMPDGSTMGAHTPTLVAQATDTPSPAEKMICTAETRTTITKILGLPGQPKASASWRNLLYTCTYRLPMGTLIVSVHRSASPTAARTYFQTHRATLGTTETLDGLGQGSYGAKTGTVVLIKDSDTLTVDATALPAVFGKQQSRRFDFAYELASAILGCWTEG